MVEYTDRFGFWKTRDIDEVITQRKPGEGTVCFAKLLGTCGAPFIIRYDTVLKVYCGETRKLMYKFVVRV